MSKTGRNDPCPCGSGKKYKKCCLNKSQSLPSSFTRSKIRKFEGELVHMLLGYVDQKFSGQALVAAWEDFVVWRDLDPFDESDETFGSDSSQDYAVPEFETLFLPWFLFLWIPDTEPYFDELDGVPEVIFPAQTMVSLYCEEKRYKHNALSRQFIEQASTQPLSYYLISHIVPGKQMTVRDIFLEQDITVQEIMGSKTLDVGVIVFGRIITVDETSVFFGMAPYVIPQSYHNYFIEYREDIKSLRKKITVSVLSEYDEDFRDVYFDIREQLFNPQMPRLQNTDGDELRLQELFYSLSCSVSEAFDALKSLSLIPEEQIRQEASFDSQGEMTAIELSWMLKGNRQHQQWDNTVMGHLNIEPGKLKINVNSDQRAEQIKRKMTRRLGKRAQFKNTVYHSTEKMMEELPEQRQLAGTNHDELAQLPEVQEALGKILEEHWENWLDQSLPALNNQTPRQASKTNKGKELLEGLLLSIQTMSSKNQPELAPDLAMLRQKLNMD